MNRLPHDIIEKQRELKIQENIAKWQSIDIPLAPLDEEQLEVVYELGDLVSNLYNKSEDNEDKDTTLDKNEVPDVIYKMQDFIKWTIAVENEIKHENLKKYQNYYELLAQYQDKTKILYDLSNNALDSLNNLKEKYESVTEKTNYLHDLSEQLMANQRILKEKKQLLNNKLQHFTNFNKCLEGIEKLGNKINSDACTSILDKIDNSIFYLNTHLHYKESRIYKMKYESLLNNILNKIYDYVNNILVETTKQVVEPDFKSIAQPQNTSNPLDSAFSLYYGKFQSVSIKVKFILTNLEEREEKNEQYKNVLNDCKKSYFIQRLPLLSVAVNKALNELKEKHQKDHSTLFRSCSLFTLKVCQDEAMCYNYFFSKSSDQLNDYLGTLCQYLYDILRPNLITINHIEVLCELCGILNSELLHEKLIDSYQLNKYVEVIRQLWQDVEERLVFRTNVFFQHDLLNYKPSPGDLAYPEKLKQMESIALELKERSDSRNSVVSLESQEVAHINAAQIAHFRSHTGNSPADLHGMWYPTVKRTLVCLSRLYFCLDRNTFQGLAQEALVICIETVQTAADLIYKNKSEIDGLLFQIKHLLIIREQIAPFQVDFTVKETTLDFSNVPKAAMDLFNHRNKIFTFGSNNALLEFLLEGTPKVKEYLIDSRKEIDKQLKKSCEAFISFVTQFLLGNIAHWVLKAEKYLQMLVKENKPVGETLSLPQQEFGKPQNVSTLINDAQKNIKAQLPEIQRLMQLYLANRETEFILFRPIKNNVINVFMQVEQLLLKGGYSNEDQLVVGCPSPEQVNILICSVSLMSGQDVRTVNT